MKSSKVVRGLLVVAVAALREHGRGEHGGRCESRLRRARGPGQQDLDPALDVRRVHRLRHRRGDDRADGGGPRAPQRDGLPQRRAVHAQRPDRRAVPRAARQVRAEGVGPARRRRHAGEPGGHRADHRRQPDPGHQVLRLRLHPDLPADLHHRGGVGRVRRVPGRARRGGTEGRPDADGAQPRHRVRGGLRRPDGVRHPDGEHRSAERRLPARPVLGDQRRRHRTTRSR